MVEIRSDILVREVGHWGTDRDIAEAAWISSGNSNASDAKVKGLLNALIRDRHGSPFDEGFLSVHVEGPRAIRDEWVRHRNLSYSSSSLRYTLSNDGAVYIPPIERPLRIAEGHKQIRPVYEKLDEDAYRDYHQDLTEVYEGLSLVTAMLQKNGITTTEALRWITTDGHYVLFRARGMLRPWLQFLQLRTHVQEANHPSYPMWEIEQAAKQVEAMVERHWPWTYEAWNKNGRDI
jgi:thymidylate synthase (FAD)